MSRVCVCVCSRLFAREELLDEALDRRSDIFALSRRSHSREDCVRLRAPEAHTIHFLLYFTLFATNRDTRIATLTMQLKSVGLLKQWIYGTDNRREPDRGSRRLRKTGWIIEIFPSIIIADFSDRFACPLSQARQAEAHESCINWRIEGKLCRAITKSLTDSCRPFVNFN